MDLKRKPSNTLEDQNPPKRRRVVSPVKSFDALKACYKLLNDFRSNADHQAYAVFFEEPVDVEKLQCPDYYQIVKHPICLSEMHEKFEKQEYKNEDDFATDMRQMFENCILYNGAEHEIAPICKRFQVVFEDKFARIKLGMEKARLSIFDKLDKKEKEVDAKIQEYELLVADLKETREDIQQQRKEEQMKLISAPPNVVVRPKIKKPKLIPRVKERKPKKSPKKKSKKQPKDVPEPTDGDDEYDETVKSDSEEEDTAASMTFDELRSLTQKINCLPGPMIEGVLKIIHKFEPERVSLSDQEVELEFQTLKPITLRTLEKFVNDFNNPKPAPKPKGRPTSKGKTMQTDAVNKAELEKQRIAIEQQLHDIESQLGMTKTTVVPPPKPSSSSSSSSSSDSSSESSSSCPSSESLAVSSDTE